MTIVSLSHELLAPFHFSKEKATTLGQETYLCLVFFEQLYQIRLTGTWQSQLMPRSKCDRMHPCTSIQPLHIHYQSYHLPVPQPL